MSSEGDELRYWLHLVQAFSFRLCPGLICPCQRQLQGSSKSNYVIPVRKEPGLFYLPDVLTKTGERSRQRTTRTIPMGCSERSVQLTVPWVIALPSSMDKTSRSSQHRGHSQIPGGGGGTSKQESFFQREKGAAEMGEIIALRN